LPSELPAGRFHEELRSPGLDQLRLEQLREPGAQVGMRDEFADDVVAEVRLIDFADLLGRIVGCEVARMGLPARRVFARDHRVHGRHDPLDEVRGQDRRAEQESVRAVPRAQRLDRRRGGHGYFQSSQPRNGMHSPSTYFGRGL
jgi:hypothetical protein